MKPARRKCAHKACRQWFHPVRDGQVVCSFECASAIGKEQTAKAREAWLLWNYSENIRFEYQVTITQWAWAEFREQIGAKKVAGKTMDRLKKLIWLAAQDVKSELAGKDVYQQQDLAALCSVKPDNWCHNYADYWRAMCTIFKRLDGDSLLNAVRTRSQQKATFSQQGIAKVN